MKNLSDNNKRAIQVSNVIKRYRNFTLDNVSFEAAGGEITALVGANGAGKTTLLSIMTDQLAADAGRIQYGGLDLQKNRIEIKSALGLVQDYNCFYEQYHPNDVRRIMKGFFKDWSDDCFCNLLSAFDLQPNAAISSFSRGMKKKLLFAVALSHKAQYIILDEITSELDPLTRNDIMEILKARADQGTTVVFSTHITSDVDNFADRLVMLDRGKLVLNDTLENIRSNYLILKFSKDEMEKAKELCRHLDSHMTKIGQNYIVLCKRKEQVAWNSNTTVPTVEDIMMLFIRGGRNGNADYFD